MAQNKGKGKGPKAAKGKGKGAQPKPLAGGFDWEAELLGDTAQVDPSKRKAAPKWADVVGQVVLAQGGRVLPEEDDPHNPGSTRTPTQVDRLIIFGPEGEVQADRENYRIYPVALGRQLATALVIGKLAMDGRTYVLEQVSDRVKAKVASIMTAHDQRIQDDAGDESDHYLDDDLDPI